MDETNITAETLQELASLFKIFADSTRLDILSKLLHQELCVGEIAEKTGMTQSAVSHQLSILRQSKLVKVRRDGKSIFYSLADEHVSEIIEIGIEHISE